MGSQRERGRVTTWGGGRERYRRPERERGRVTTWGGQGEVGGQREREAGSRHGGVGRQFYGTDEDRVCGKITWGGHWTGEQRREAGSKVVGAEKNHMYSRG